MGKKENKDQPSQPKQDGPIGPVDCGAETCRTKADRFGFCSEHYVHFKFGLITRKGEKVSDYDKKFEHFKVFQERERSKQAA